MLFRREKEKEQPQTTAKRSTRTTLSHPGRENNFLGILVFIAVFGFVGFIAPFIHIVFKNSTVEGVFGFKKISSFLYAIGFPLLSICAGVLLHLAAALLEDTIAKAFKICAVSFTFVGFYFAVWVLTPSISDFSPMYYYASMVIVSVLMTLALGSFSKYLFNINQRIKNLKASLKSMFGFVYDMPSNDLVNPLKIKEFDINKLKITNSILDQNEQ